MRLKRLWVFSQLFLLMLGLVLVIAPEWPVFADEWHQLKRLIGLGEFDFLVWEVEAIISKGEAELVGGHLYLDEATRREIVLSYLQRVDEARQVSNEIALLFAESTVTEPFAAAAPLQSQLDILRADVAQLQPLAESILQEQIASVLLDEGFSPIGQTFPPVLSRISPLPLLLVVSRRDRIEELYRVSLVPGQTTPEIETLEATIYNQLDRSALVVPLGGIGTYPAMILETTNLVFLTDVIAHEWAHNWLTLRPLGLNYNADSTMRVINETVASVFGEAIGLKVLERYYPDLVPPPPSPVLPNSEPQAPPTFDFRAEMSTTRIQAEKLLAEGKITEAETYMEERRLLFVANGYLVRKINQAYFAFYGSYADQPGATGGDPTGPMVVTIFQQSGSIHTFMQQVAPITSFDDLQTLYQQIAE